MNIAELKERRAFLTRQLDEWRRISDSVTKALKNLSAEFDALSDQFLANISDEELLVDPAALTLLSSLAGMTAYRRLNKIANLNLPLGLNAEGQQTHDGVPLVALSLTLRQDQDVSAIADAMRAWVSVWGLGRTEISVDITESTLSLYSSYWATWNLQTDELSVFSRRGGVSSTRPLISRPLAEGLAFVAAKLPMYGPGGESLNITRWVGEGQ